jgi:SAM-dependent methyltransferase/uncharacterized protein YbaR (Trm112 family)
MQSLRLPTEFQKYLECPKCHQGPLIMDQDGLRCPDLVCDSTYPIVEGCPVLINDENSLFLISDFVAHRKTTGEVAKPKPVPTDSVQRIKDQVKALARRFTPSISKSASDYPIPRALKHITETRGPGARILVIGAGDRSLEIETPAAIVYTDVDLGERTHMICDGHDIPFADGTFDAVFCDSVLEHVVDPARCVSEIHRVLNTDGFVYAITPFMQQVHMGRYDFTRFTHLGHRLLFRRFKEVATGVSNGPGMALTWSAERFISGFARSPRIRSLLRTLARFLLFPIKYFDDILARRDSAYDNASAYYFFGTRSNETPSDRELVRGYRGVIS